MRERSRPQNPQTENEQSTHLLRVVLTATGISIAAVIVSILIVLLRLGATSPATRTAVRDEALRAFPRKLLPMRFEVIESLSVGRQGQIGDNEAGAVAYVHDPVTGNCFLAAEQFVENIYRDSNVAYTLVPCATLPSASVGRGP